MQKIDELFKEFIENTQKEKYSSPLEIPVTIWESASWEFLSKKEVHSLLLPFIKWQVKRAIQTMPEIYRRYEDKKINPDALETIEDFWQIPALVKDSGVAGFGFREKLIKNPFIMKPNDVQSNIYVFKSGGTRGIATPTFITNKDRRIEAGGLKRCFEYMGITKDAVVLRD